MKICKLIRRAAYVSAAFVVAINAAPAWAGNCQVANNASIDSQVPFTLNICAEVQNTFTTAVTDADFGNVGVTGWNGESGCLIMNPGGTFDETNTACATKTYPAAPVIARIVSEDDAGSTPKNGVLAITGAFTDQEIRMWFQVGTIATTNVMAPSLAVGPNLYYTALTADVGATGTLTQAGLWTIDAAADDPENVTTSYAVLDANAQKDVADATGGTFKGDTDAAGALDINIGATIQTDGTFTFDSSGVAANGHYPTDEYDGTFDVVVFY